MRLARKAQVLMVVGVLALAAAYTTPARAAFWEELSDLAFAPEQVCQNGISFSLAASDEYSYDVFATLDSDSTTVINGERVTLKPVPVADENLSGGGRSHSGFFALRWSRTLTPGTIITFDFVPVGDAQSSGDPTKTVQDCFISPPTTYLPLLVTP